jgi:hypothetical protein
MHGLAAGERVQGVPGEIIFVPRAEEGAGADDERILQRLQHLLFRLGLAEAIDIGRAPLVALAIGPA